MAAILHVEDDPNDVVLVELAFRKASASARLEVARDGPQAIAALQGRPAGQGPALVLLDLKLPGQSGLEVLAWIRNQPGLRSLPVVILSSSSQPEDIGRAYELGANSFVVKPPGLDDLVNLARTLDNYWLHTNVWTGLARD